MKKNKNAIDKFVPFGAPKFSCQPEREVLDTLRSGGIPALKKANEISK